jgi:hypothetical protein
MQEPAPTSQATTPFDGITIPTCGIAQIAPKGLYKYWTTDADESISDLYDKIKEDVAFPAVLNGRGTQVAIFQCNELCFVEVWRSSSRF